MSFVDHSSHYLKLRLAQCAERPRLHVHQIEALRQLQSTTGPADPSDPNHFWPLIRAELLDRYANQYALYDALGDDRLKSIAAKMGAEVRSTAALEQLAPALNRAITATRLIYTDVATCIDALSSLVLLGFDWAIGGDNDRRITYEQTMKVLWRTLQEHDPGCNWERVESYPPYRNCLPFSSDGLAQIGSWIAKAVGPQLVRLPPPRDNGPIIEYATFQAPPTIETISQAAIGYHDAYQQAQHQPHTEALCAIYERVFTLENESTSVAEFSCKLIEQDIDCAIARASNAQVANQALSHCAEISQPHIESHYRQLEESLANAQSPTEVAFETMRHDACFSVESTWNRLLIHYAFRPLMETLRYELAPSRQRRNVIARSYRVNYSLLGSWEKFWQVGRFWNFFCKMIFPRTNSITPNKSSESSFRGEVGVELLSAYRHEALVEASTVVANRGGGGSRRKLTDSAARKRLAEPRFADPESMRDHITELFLQVSSEHHFEAPAENPGVIYWGKHVSLGELEEALWSPARPCPANRA